MMRLYVTNNFFNKELYVEYLNNIGVNAEVVEDGVMLNIEQYKANYKRQNQFLAINHRFIQQLY